MIDVIDHAGASGERRIRELRFARPPANAFDGAFLTKLERCVTEAPGSGAAAVVISGAPGMFTGGLDVPTLLALGRDEIRELWRRFYATLRAVAASEIPVCAAITGHSPAAGAVLAVFCDYRVMAEGPFKIGMNEVQVGLVPPPPLQYALKRLTGPRAGDALLVAGALVGPAEALRVGLVDEVVALDRVVPAAIAWGERLAALPREAMLETRRLARADLVAQLDDLGERALDEATARWLSDETQRALHALVARLATR
ncbi:MAG: enoyl-CoA hydratase/isomerase family protein [Gemmatimonadales bacterium]